MSAVDHDAELAYVDEKHFAAADAEAMILFVAGDEPEACRNLRRVEKLAGQRDHAVHEIGFDDVLPDFAFPGLIRRHRAVREDKTCDSVRCKMIDDVLHPGEVGV